MSSESRDDQVNSYGIWAWAVGLSFGVALTWFMFHLADGFH
mgnify:FL=1